MFDLFIGICAFPFVMIAVCIFGPIIYFEDKGPIFYKAQRIAKGGQSFSMLKFRSMKVNAPDIRLENGDTFNSENDPRVTKIGRFMRRNSVDEIPQFLNVLFGQMSLVGPRPDTLDFMEVYKHEFPSVLTIKPGITGYNQAYFRNGIDGRVKMKNDTYYADHVSFALDIRIIFRTFLTVLQHKNVYVDADTK